MAGRPLADCLKRNDNILGPLPLARRMGPAGPASGVKGDGYTLRRGRQEKVGNGGGMADNWRSLPHHTGALLYLALVEFCP